jgi:hypothetical protein
VKGGREKPSEVKAPAAPPSAISITTNPALAAPAEAKVTSGDAVGLHWSYTFRDPADARRCYDAARSAAAAEYQKTLSEAP